MLVSRRSPIIDYDRLCNQTVTVYRKQETKEEVYEGEKLVVFEETKIIRKVYERAFFDFKKTMSVDKLGASEAMSFLLIIPGDTQTVYPGDKVYLGNGPKFDPEDPIELKAWIYDFIPSNTDGLVVVKYADPKYWNGKIVHTEAGG